MNYRLVPQAFQPGVRSGLLWLAPLFHLDFRLGCWYLLVANHGWVFAPSTGGDALGRDLDLIDLDDDNLFTRYLKKKGKLQRVA